MSASKAIGLYVAAVILLGALLAPWLFWGVQQTAPHVPALRVYATYPFHRVFDRAILLVALAGLWPLLRTTGLRFGSDIGYVRARGWWRHLLAGYVLGILSLTLLVVILVMFGGRQLTINKSSAQMTGAALKFLCAGVAVALIEETLFRGALQGMLQRRLHVALAVVIASAVYSAVHFLKPAGVNISANQVTWTSGGKCLAWIATQSMRQKGVPVQFVSLFLAGCVLGLAYARTGAIYLSLGLHAGWVLVNEFVRWSATLNVTQEAASWPMLMALLVLIFWLCQKVFQPLRDPGLSSSGRAAPST
ncbi:MAG TPA: CPBP family intramembrane glutamic endopeptidase [Verrucomicrobiae bacterium]|nr:CPBP family intramembrane glutamic endopeptidase [Verrucomicrobiae bacterium]